MTHGFPRAGVRDRSARRASVGARPLLVLAFLLACVLLPACAGEQSSARGDSSIRIPEVTASDLARRLEEGEPLVLLDVRTPGEFAHSRIEGSLNVPHYEIRHRLAELEAYRDRPVVIFCEADVRSEDVARQLLDEGFGKVELYRGGMSEWRKRSH